MSDLILVVPVYNEASRLDPAPWLEFLAADRSRALIFVDDGSRDGTPTVLETIRAAAPAQISILGLPENRGKAEAVRHGMVQALAATVRYAGFIDADLSAPLSEVSLLQVELDARPAVWAAFGSRVRATGPPDRAIGAAPLPRPDLRHLRVVRIVAAGLRYPVRAQVVPQHAGRSGRFCDGLPQQVDLRRGIAGPPRRLGWRRCGVAHPRGSAAALGGERLQPAAHAGFPVGPVRIGANSPCLPAAAALRSSIQILRWWC